MQEHWLHISLSSGAHGGRAVSVDWGVWGLQVTVTSSALDHSINIQRRHLVLCADKTLWRVFYPPISALSPIFTSLSFEGITLQSPELRFCLFFMIIFFHKRELLARAARREYIALRGIADDYSELRQHVTTSVWYFVRGGWEAAEVGICITMCGQHGDRDCFCKSVKGSQMCVSTLQLAEVDGANYFLKRPSRAGLSSIMTRKHIANRATVNPCFLMFHLISHFAVDQLWCQCKNSKNPRRRFTIWAAVDPRW